LTASYDTGIGSPSEIEATAGVDCLLPVISTLTVTDIDGFSARISFATSEPASVRVLYGTSCGALTSEIEVAQQATSHSIVVTGLSPNVEYFFSVEASDEAGNLGTDDNNGACNSFTTLENADYFTELFDTSDQDLANTSVTFTPATGENGYSACTSEATVFPTDPSTATDLFLSDDDFSLVTLSGGAEVAIYGTTYDSFYVGSNGYLTFGAGHTDMTESLAEHFSIPRISGLYDDLNPAAGGTISWQQLGDRAAFTWSEVPEWNIGGQNSFQVELFFDGSLRITYLALSASDGLVGLSKGEGIPGDYLESNFAAYPECTMASVCGDGNVEGTEECDDGGTSDGDCCSSTCQYETTGSACGDGTDTLCDSADSCDGSGSCQDNLAAAATTCGDAGGECIIQDLCDGAGACSDNGYVANGTACGDGTDTLCDSADSCDGSGSCQTNFAAISVECRVDAGECDVAESCDGVGACPADGFETAGSACGDGTDTLCDSADSCDASGSCQANYAAISVECRADAGDCDVAETCNGAGACPVDELEEYGTACGDPADQCTHQDICNFSGTCLDGGLVPDGSVCSDENPATFDDQCSAGICEGSGSAPVPTGSLPLRVLLVLALLGTGILLRRVRLARRP
ncbi:MAG: hypothetical protein VCC02_10525, partial [Myxococcota bacterium]